VQCRMSVLVGELNSLHQLRVHSTPRTTAERTRGPSLCHERFHVAVHRAGWPAGGDGARSTPRLRAQRGHHCRICIGHGHRYRHRWRGVPAGHRAGAVLVGRLLPCAAEEGGSRPHVVVVMVGESGEGVIVMRMADNHQNGTCGKPRQLSHSPILTPSSADPEPVRSPAHLCE